MRYYDDRGPIHAHRSPAELAEDEILAALRGTLQRPLWRAVGMVDKASDESSSGPNRMEREEHDD